MEQQIYLISLYLAVEEKFDDIVGERRLRARGFAPALSDIELVTIELFGEYQGHGNDKSIWHYNMIRNYRNGIRHGRLLLMDELLSTHPVWLISKPNGASIPLS
ncbi:MAG: hypothetical protein GY927_04635 [bacterium]|nr:hypothetical protein [bacterium]